MDQRQHSERAGERENDGLGASQSVIDLVGRGRCVRCKRGRCLCSKRGRCLRWKCVRLGRRGGWTGTTDVQVKGVGQRWRVLALGFAARDGGVALHFDDARAVDAVAAGEKVEVALSAACDPTTVAIYMSLSARNYGTFQVSDSVTIESSNVLATWHASPPEHSPSYTRASSYTRLQTNFKPLT